jgi:hypothetical protein
MHHFVFGGRVFPVSDFLEGFHLGG